MIRDWDLWKGRGNKRVVFLENGRGDKRVFSGKGGGDKRVISGKGFVRNVSVHLETQYRSKFYSKIQFKSLIENIC